MYAIGIGEVAALLAAVSWAESCRLHTIAGRMIGPVVMTTVRIPLYLAGAGLVAMFSGAGVGVPAGSFWYILASALFGIAVCDPCLYAASVSIGPRLASLIQSLSACLTAIFGFLFLGEHINFMGWLGIVAASFGVAFVLMEGGVKQGIGVSGPARARLWRGAGLAFIAAASLAASFLFLKRALVLGLDPIWATFLRIGLGGIMLWGFMAARGKLGAALKSAFVSWRLMRLLLIAAGVSTVGNCLMPLAMRCAESGIVATLIGLQPIIITGMTSAIERKLPTARAVVGAVIAFSGAAMIFLR